MRKPTGFTLIELMVVIAILGILATTAMPFYQTWTQRAYGTQATAMMKNLTDGQIMHYLEHNRFFPDVGETVIVPEQGVPDPPNAIDSVNQALKVNITQGQRFDYVIVNYGDDCGLTISAPFPLFKGQGRPGSLIALVTKDGRVTYVGP